MKIKFSSAKEQQPTQEQGLQVLYAPGKRLAFRVRCTSFCWRYSVRCFG